MDDSA
jgi:hypothetical protein